MSSVLLGSNIWQTKIKKILKPLIISVLGLVVVTSTGFKPVTSLAVIKCAIQLRHEACLRVQI